MKEKQYLARIGKELQQKYKKGVSFLERGNYTAAEEVFVELKEDLPAFPPFITNGLSYIFTGKIMRKPGICSRKP